MEKGAFQSAMDEGKLAKLRSLQVRNQKSWTAADFPLTLFPSFPFLYWKRKKKRGPLYVIYRRPKLDLLLLLLLLRGGFDPERETETIIHFVQLLPAPDSFFCLFCFSAMKPARRLNVQGLPQPVAGSFISRADIIMNRRSQCAREGTELATFFIDGTDGFPVALHQQRKGRGGGGLIE